MNKIYKVIWNSQLKCWQAVSELAKNHSTSHSTVADKNTLTGSVKKVSAMALMRWALWGVGLLPLSIYAAISNTELPTGANITQGSANIAQNGNTLNIHQNTQRLSTNWDTFNIGKDATVNFNQQNQSSIAINRVLDSNASQIMGRLNANGQVFLLNPNGVIFSKTAQVNIGGLVASTLNLTDSDIQNGKFTLTGNPNSTARVENHGSIQTLSGGTVALIAPNVKNTGRISSPNGTTHLTAASQVTLALQDGSLTQYQVDQGVFKGLVDNGGAIIADNGAVYLTAKAKDRLSKAVVNHSGIIEANRLSQNAKGEIILLGDMQNGETNVSGVLKAEGRNGQDGGFIETSAAKVKIENSTVVSTRSQGGKTGNWLIDPIDFNINAGNAAQDSSGMGATTLANNLANNNVTVQTSTGGSQKGDINVNAEVKWDSANSLTLNAHNDININANITATHNKGKLNLIYGQDTANRDANYKLNKGAKINLRAGDNFSTKKGTEATVEYKVITALGKQDSTTGTDLQGINGNLNGNYVLGADIDAEETLGWNASRGFNPIGSINNPFRGKLDGLGHTVSKLYINRREQDYIGLIGYAWGAQIRNIGLLEANIRGGDYVGGLVGVNRDSSIQNAYSTGSVSGNNSVGGLVGDNISSDIRNAYSTASVSGQNWVGGLVGINSGSIRNAYATGNVSGQNWVGGLVGWNLGSINNAYATGAVSGKINVGGLVGRNRGSIRNAYATGAVSGNDSVGGLVGLNDENGSIRNAYATGAVSGNDSVGGLVGLNDENGSINNAYWNTETTGQNSSAGGDCNTNNYCGLTTVEMFQKNNMKGFDFKEVWGNAKDQTTPYLLGLNDNQVFNKNDLPVGAITATNRPALYTAIQNIQQLQNMQSNLAGNYAVVNHIDATETKDWNDGQGFNPIGDENNSFKGKLDGLGHTVSKLYINRPRQEYIGLIGYARGAQIQNIGLLEVNIRGGSFVGGLVGYNGDSSSIHNAYSTGSVSGNIYVGGLVGINIGSIDNAYSTASVSGNSSVGGLVGSNGGSINDAYTTGAFSGRNWVGGLVGQNIGSIRNAYATGSVSGQDWVGGLVGYNGGSINNAYATGSVSGQDWVGGLVGNSLGGSINNAYATGSVSGRNSVGGLVGINSGSIDNAYATGHVSGNNNIGGLVGNSLGGSVNNAYWNIETTGQNSSAGGKGLTTVEMFQKNNMKGFDFKEVWGNAKDQTTPYLLGLNNNQVFNKNDLPVGAITATNRPALYTAIQNIQQLQNMQSNLAGNYAVVNHIDATETKDWNDGQGFKPIGDYNNNNENPFNGKLDGLGHTVSKLYINRPEQDDIGLIGYAWQAQIRNIGLLEANIRGSGFVGALVGRNLVSRIQNAYSTGAVSGQFFVGGLVGNNGSGSINNAYSTASVSGQDYVGGLVGVNGGLSSVNNAYATGAVSGKNSVGGLVGDNRGSINNAYATGSVSGNDAVGGLVGNNQGNLGQVYATGQVKGTTQTGGLIGYHITGIVENAYWDIESTGQKDSWAGGNGVKCNTNNYCGLTSAQMKDGQSFAFIDADSYLGGKNTIWRIYQGDTAPLLRSFLTQLDLNTQDATTTYNGKNQSLADVTGLDPNKIFGGKSGGYRNAGSHQDRYYSNQQGYDLIGVKNTASDAVLTINKATLNLNAVTDTRSYDGTNQSTGMVDISGLQTDDRVTAKQEFDSKNAGERTLNIAEVIINDGNNGGNYNIVTNTAKGVINKAKATVTANSLNTTYNGKDQTASGFTAKGLVNGETESVLTDVKASVSAKDAGKYTNTATGTDKNYELIFVDGALEIAKAKATVTANSLNTTYNGKEQTVSGFTASGLVNGETESVLTDVSAKATGKDAGNYVNKANGTDKNYELIFVDGSLDIAKAKATITANSLNTVYNGKDQTVSGFTASGLVNGETESVLTDVSAKATDKDAGNYANKANGTDKNYELIFVDGSLDIAKAKATITANSLNTVYNGKDQTVSGFTASGLVNGETESVLSDVKASVSAKDAGQYANTAKGTDKNYELSFVDGVLDIAKAKATVTANSLNTTYNGKEQTVSGFTASGLVNGETESVLTDVSAKATGKDAGNYKNQAKGTDKNYELTFIDGALDIAKAKATITANSLNTVYNGKDQTVSGFTASGLVNGETESVLSDVKASVSAKDAGQYANKANGTDKNYELIFVDGSLDIAKAKATVTANSLNTVYNGKDQTVSGFTASGLVNGETESVLSDVSAKATGKDAGNYANKAKGTDKNYELTFIDGVLDIAKAKINQVKGITANNRVYDGTTNASLNTDLAQFEGLLTGDELAVASATGKFNDKNVGTGKPVSIQDIRLTGADAHNYQLVDNTAMTTADIYTLTPLAYLRAKQFKPPRYLPETHSTFDTVDLEVRQGGVNIAGIQTLAGEH